MEKIKIEALMEALKKLKQHTDDWVAMGDAKIACKNNQYEFIQKYIPVMQYYRYIITRTNPFDQTDKSLESIGLEALSVLSNAMNTNPSLSFWINDLISNCGKKSQKQKPIQDTFDPQGLSNHIHALTEEVRQMSTWDTDKISVIEFALKKDKEKLMANYQSFNENLCRSLMNDINLTLSRIASFNVMVKEEEEVWKER